MSGLAVYEERRIEADKEREAARVAARSMSRRVQNIAAHLAECRYLAAVYLNGEQRRAALMNVAALTDLLMPALEVFEAVEKSEEASK